MKLYKPQNQNNGFQNRVGSDTKRDTEDYWLAWVPDQPNSFLGKLIYNLAFNNLFVPIAFLTLFLAIIGLLILAFGKNSDWNGLQKGLVAVGVPAIVLSMIVNKRVGNIVMAGWMLLVYLTIASIALWMICLLLGEASIIYSEIF